MTTTERYRNMPHHTAPVARPRPVRKADDATAPIPVYDAKGKLVGVIDPAKLTRVADTDADALPPLDMTPAPSAEVGVPAGEVAKLRKSMTFGTTPAERAAAIDTLNAAAADRLAQIRRRPRR